MAEAAIVFCAGGPAGASLPELPDDVLVIAADGGVAEAERLDFHVDLLVGDLDSATPEAVARVEAAGGSIQRHPVDKDASDSASSATASSPVNARSARQIAGPSLR